MDTAKNKDNAAEEGRKGIPFGLVAIFLAALAVGFVVANPGLNLFGANSGNYCSGFAKQTNQQNNVVGLAGAAGNITNNQSGNISDEVQEIRMSVDASGWTPDSFVLKKGVRVRWIIDVKELTSCNNEIIVRDYGLDIKLRKGENVVEFTPSSTGVVRWSCWMGMIQGTFIVVNEPANQTEVDAANASAASVKKGGSCGCGCGGR